MTHLRRVTTEVIESQLVSKTTVFNEDPGDIPPLRFETGHEGREAELLSRYAWERIMILLELGQELEQNQSLRSSTSRPPLGREMERPT